MGHAEIEGLKVADAIYSQLAVNQDDSRSATALDLLRVSGYYGLVGNSQRLLEGLAAIGLANTLTGDRMLMQIPLTQMGVSITGVEEQLNAYFTEHGLRLVVSDNQHLLAMI